ncbi:DUF3307 domain-containing protein [Alteromonas sp.]|uniref:DUF3307 domain-containing protein n=1 Tax=Alteromonas sp. TaxID=232 RepID=UPI00257C18AA|nr:DUF3307 domain-containing protein [Alteromonas sp.]|tara:strand:- start:17900 stop:18541 length:642 start_codon:yes stop_codon:yes gene_type:complete
MEAIGIEVPSVEVLNMGEIGAEQLQLQQLALIAGLLVAHVLGDFYFQPAGWVKSRNTKHLLSPALYLHALLHGVLAFFALLILSLFATLATKETGAAATGVSTTGLSAASITAIELTPLFLVAIGVMVTHFIIDAVKSYASPTTFCFCYRSSCAYYRCDHIVGAVNTTVHAITAAYLRHKLSPFGTAARLFNYFKSYFYFYKTAAFAMDQRAR